MKAVRIACACACLATVGLANSVPTGVDIECAFIEIDDANARPLLSAGLSAEMILGLVKQGKATVVTAPMIRTFSGMDAEIKAVTEYIYPTKFEARPFEQDEPSTNGVLITGPVDPGGFEAREVGVIFQVTPEVSADGKSLALSFSPDIVLPPIWKTYNRRLELPEGGVGRPIQIEQPYFHTIRVTTTVKVPDGGSVLVGGGILNPVTKRPMYMVVTAKITITEGS